MNIEDEEIKHEKSSVCSVVTVSIGVKCIDFKYDYEMSREEMYREADEALIRAKTMGMNKYIFATS